MSKSSDGSLKAIFYALGANTGIAIAKFVAAAFTGSGAMLAEAIHSTADCANQGLLLLGIKQAKAPETDDHPLGHHRVVYFWTMMVALLLFFVGGAFSLYEGIERILHPEPLKYAMVAVLVLGVSVALESFSLWGAMKEIKKESGGKPLLAWFRETRQSELMVVAGEDIAALAGLATAFIAVVLSFVTGNPVFDALGSIVVGFILMVVAALLLREVKSLIVGESASPEIRDAITTFVEEQPEVAKVFRIITLAHGDRLVIAVKAKMTEQTSATKMVDDINVVEQRIQDKFPSAHWVFFEPDVK
jgi:cation diffusion facilitator family transporter